MNKLLKEFKSLKKYNDEEFKFVIYPNINKYNYVVSNYGRIFNYINLKEKKQHIDQDGYMKTCLMITDQDGNRIGRNIFVHRLVAYAFCEKPYGCELVNHLDGHKDNNFYKNLEWTTPKGNTQHAILTGLQVNSGPNCPSAIYDEKIIRFICSQLEEGHDVFEIYQKLSNSSKVHENKALYMLIFSIKSGTRHASISKEYNIPKDVVSSKRKKFTNDEVKIMTEMLISGKTSTEIIQFFGGHSSKDKLGKRIFDKIRIIRKKLSEESSTTRES